MPPLKQHIVQSLCLFYHTRQIKTCICAPSMKFTVKEFKVDASELKLKGFQFSPGRRCLLQCLFLHLKETSEFTKMVRPAKGNGAVGICVGIYLTHLQLIFIGLLLPSHSY